MLGTFGRGVYVMDGLEVIRAWVAGGEDNDFGGRRTSSPDAGVMSEWRRPGERFPADSYVRDNKGRGARIRSISTRTACRPLKGTNCCCMC